jgi:hypothetical protein
MFRVNSHKANNTQHSADAVITLRTHMTQRQETNYRHALKKESTLIEEI